MYTLSQIPDILADRPDCLKFLEVWQCWRSDRPMPLRSDVRPEMLGGSITSLSNIEVEAPERMILRTTASILAPIRTQELKGRNLIELTAPELRQSRITRLTNLLKQPCGAILGYQVVLSDGADISIESLMLPVAGNTPTEYGFLYLANEIAGDKNWSHDAKYDNSPMATRFDYVDIGYGLPDNPV
jgi:hypothetical protein